MSQPVEQVDQHPHPDHPDHSPSTSMDDQNPHFEITPSDEPASKRARVASLPLTLIKSKSKVLTRSKFAETIDPKLCQRMIDAGVLYRTKDGGWMDREYGCTEEQQVQKLAKKIKDGILLVQYTAPKTGFGRVNPKGAMSLGSLRKDVRHTLCGDDWWDFDVAKCHHAILRQLCCDNGIVCVALAYYVDNREDCLEQVIGLFKEGDHEDQREHAKILYIRVLYGGSVKKWCADNKSKLVDKPAIPQSVTDLEREVKRISKTMQQCNPDIVKAVRDLHKKSGKDYNFDGSFLSYYAQEWERRVLECVFTMMKEKGFVNDAHDCVLCFDGIMVRRENCMETSVGAIIEECQDVVRDKLGLDLVFTEKAMTKSLIPKIDAAEKAERDFGFPTDKMTWLDTVYMNSLPSYKQKKRYFESFVGKIVMSTEFMWTRTEIKTDAYGFDTIDHVLESFDENRLSKALRHVGSGKNNRFGNESRFIEEWLKDKETRVFNHVEFAPYNGVFDPKQDQARSGPTVYNDFKGYNSHIKAPLPYTTKEYRNHVLREFYALGTEIFEGKRSFFQYYLMCVAFKVQFPARKHPYIFILIGKEGTGKTMLMDVIGRMFGAHHYYSTTDPEDLFGKHAEGYVGRLWIVMNEVDGKSTMDIQCKLKGAGSDPDRTCNRKCLRPIQVKDLGLYNLVTNKHNPLKMETAAKERRNVVSKGTDEYLKNFYDERFWTRLNGLFRSPEFIRCLYDECNEMDLTGVDWKQLRRDNLTSSYYDLAAQYADIEAIYFEELCQKIKCKDTEWHFMPELIYSNQTVDWEKPIRFRERDLHAKCVDWAVDRKHYQKSQPSCAKFIAKCKHLDLPLTTENNPLHDGLKTRAFVPKHMHEHIVARKWIEPDETDASDADEDDDDDPTTFCRKLIDDLVDKVIHKCEINDRFTFRPSVASAC